MIARIPYFPHVPKDVRTLFEKEQLALLGITDAVEDPHEESAYKSWLASGAAGSMEYMHTHADAKYRPQKLLSNCASILMVGLNYYQKPRSLQEGHGRIARYAWGRDYHKVFKKRLRRIAQMLQSLYPDHQFRNFSDATPLEERYYAERAGLGFTGRNTLLISSQYGSWFLIGEILSTKKFPPSQPTEGKHGACPSGCRKCLDVCPTGALTSPYRIDARLCIAYLTIEHKGSIPIPLRPKIGNWLFGCDLCQEVCPLNVRAQVTTVDDFLVLRAGSDIDLKEILTIKTDEDFVHRFAGSPVMRTGRRGLVRNACVVAANIGASHLLPQLKTLCTDADEIIAEHALWATDVLHKST